MSDDARLHWRWQQRRLQQLRGRMQRRLLGPKSEATEKEISGTGDLKQEAPNESLHTPKCLLYSLN